MTYPALTRRICAAAVLAVATAGAASAQTESRPPPLPIEPIGIVETLPQQYPESWFLLHDAAFFHMSDGKVIVVDTAQDTVAEQIQGTFNVSLIGNILQSSERGEIYATETFHSRGTRGERRDYLTIWDQKTLSPVGEVFLPGKKRFMGMPGREALLLLNKGKWLAVANFSPASSATIIDLDTREIISEVATPGCTFVYPTATRGFSALCADGRFLSTTLKADGSIDKQVRTASFFSSDDNPIFERPAVMGDRAWFPSIDGMVWPVDFSGAQAKVGEAWNLVPETERAEGWAPGGIGIIDEDDLGRFYVLMHPDAKDGSQNGGGSEVWVYDPKKKSRVLRIPLQEWGLSIAVSRGKQPKLLVTNPVTMAVELYDGQSGDYLKTLTGLGQETPLMLYGAK
ncbi:amine dehydrogenase large subunit [Parahaliea mediterranea]|uniref:amine dehydrogenase large subunit n=1 Tax=Parahaliea mediterranea TaxID=651086 RepID=UPI00130080F2|nr:amine dehydrogenase large subunit [Parahaliea mediterranea]